MRFALIDKTGRVENVVEAESAEKLAALFPALTVLPHDRAGPGWRLGDSDLVEPEPEPSPDPALWDELPTYQFLALFSPQEWRGYKAARDADATVDHLLLILEHAPSVHRTHPLVQQGLAAGVALGILSAERAREIGG